MISRLRVAAHPVNPCRPARAESHHRHLHTSTAAYLVSLRHEQPYVVVSDGIRIVSDAIPPQTPTNTSSSRHRFQAIVITRRDSA